jgi:uncharacterized protein YjcR
MFKYDHMIGMDKSFDRLLPEFLGLKQDNAKVRRREDELRLKNDALRRDIERLQININELRESQVGTSFLVDYYLYS